jgi:hypothetical protein
MIKFFKAGGFNMWVIAVLGIVILWHAVKFARGADARRLAVLRALTWTLVFNSITGFVVGLGVTAVNAMKWRSQYPLEESLLQGFSESSSNLIFGGSFLAITWGLIAVGVHRMPGDPP